MTGPGLISLFCFLMTAAYFCAAGCVRAPFCAWAWRFFHFPVAAGFAGASRFCCRLPCFSGGRKLASGQAVDDGRGAFPALDFHSGCCAVASCGGHSMAEARRKEFARSGAGPQPRIFRFRICFCFAGCAGSFPFADGGAHLAVAGVNGLAILLLAWWGGYCAEGLLNPQTSPRRRQVMWTVFASAFFLQFLLGVTVASSLLMTGKLHIPVPFMMISGPVYREEGFFMLALFSVSVLMAGSSWCSHLCYFGVWDCLAAASSRRKGHPVPGGKKPVTGGGFPLPRRWGFPSFCPCGAFRWGMPWRRRSP